MWAVFYGRALANKLDQKAKMTGFDVFRFLLEASITGQMGLFAVYLISTGDRRPARLALAGLAAIFATVSIINAVTSTGQAVWLRPVNLVLELSMGPTIYLFVQQMRDDPPVIHWWSLGHLFPLVVGPLLLALRNMVPVDAIVVAIHSGYMIAIAVTVIRGRQKYQRNSVFRLVSLFAGFFLLLIVFRITMSVESGLGRDFRMSGSYLAVLMGMLFLSGAIIVTALHNPKVLDVSRAFTKYAGSNATPGEIDLILKRLDHALREDNLFRNPTLTLADLAIRIKAPAKHVSQAVNERRGMSVPSLINAIRIESAAAELSDRTSPKRTITEIMLDAGFGSKSSFQREFQRRYGMSPSEYRHQSDETLNAKIQ